MIVALPRTPNLLRLKHIIEKATSIMDMNPKNCTTT